MPKSSISVALGAAALLASGPAHAAAQLLTVTEVCTPVSCMSAANRPVVLRVVDNSVTFKGNLVDLADNPVPSDPRVHISVLRKYNCGTGCVDAVLKVDPDFPIDQTRTFAVMFRNLVGTASVTMFVVRAGRMQTMRQTPSTATTGQNPSWGDSVDVRITGVDIGHASVSVLSGSTQIVRNTDAELVFRTTANSGATQPNTVPSLVPITVKESGVTLMPAWRYIGPGSFGVAYRPAGEIGCIANSGVVPPWPISPANGAAIAYANDPEKALVSLSWSPALTSSGNGTEQPYTKYQYEVTLALGTVTLSGDARTGTPLSSPTSTSLTMPTLTATTAIGVKQASVSLSRNSSYKWRVRSIQCANTSSPTVGAYSAYATFTTK